MPTSDQQNMSSRSGPSPNGPWSVPARRSTDNSTNNGERLGSANVDVSRILERLGEIETLMGSARRQAQAHPVSGSNAPNSMPNIPPPPGGCESAPAAHNVRLCHLKILLQCGFREILLQRIPMLR